MRFGILSRNKNLHSIKRLLQEAKKRRVTLELIDPLECQLMVAGKESEIYVGKKPLPALDAVLPRIGASITDYGLAVVRQLELLGTFAVNGSRAIAESRDKMRCLQVMAKAGLHTPPTVLTRNSQGIEKAIEACRGLPVVVKVLEGTQGVGVMLLNTPIALTSVLDALWGLEQDVLLQHFIAEGAGRDYRALVIGDKVVASMMRTAPKGEFRSNIHRGGEGRVVKLSRAYSQAAVKAAKQLGLAVAGVDMMESAEGPMILEVNSSPGFEGLERATRQNIAGMILDYMMKEVKKQAKKAPRRPKKRSQKSLRAARGARASGSARSRGRAARR